MISSVGLLSALATVAVAFTAPKYGPSGNPLAHPGLNEQVPVGKPYNIVWNPTCAGTVSIVLLRGPSTNVVPLFPIVEKVANSGSFPWTPPATLENDSTHYGIEIICDTDGQYQYSTQFGVNNPSYVQPSVSVSVPVSALPSSTPYGGLPSATPTLPASSSVTGLPTTLVSIASSSSEVQPVSASPSSATSSYPCTITLLSTTGTVYAPTGASAPSNVIQPSAPLSVPASLASAGAQSSVVPYSSVQTATTNGAGRLGGSVAALLAVSAVAVLLL